MSDPKLPSFTEVIPNTFLVAEDAQTKDIAGCVGLTKLVGKGSMQLQRMIVNPKFQASLLLFEVLSLHVEQLKDASVAQGCGLGRRLVEAAKEHVKSKSVLNEKEDVCPQKITLITTDFQYAAQRLYRKCGFKLVGTHQKIHGPPFPYSYYLYSTKIKHFSIDL